jgi:hypothetical protein
MVEEAMLNSLVTTMLAEAGVKNATPSQLVDFLCCSRLLSKIC